MLECVGEICSPNRKVPTFFVSQSSCIGFASIFFSPGPSWVATRYGGGETVISYAICIEPYGHTYWCNCKIWIPRRETRFRNSNRKGIYSNVVGILAGGTLRGIPTRVGIRIQTENNWLFTTFRKRLAVHNFAFCFCRGSDVFQQAWHPLPPPAGQCMKYNNVQKIFKLHWCSITTMCYAEEFFPSRRLLNVAFVVWSLTQYVCVRCLCAVLACFDCSLLICLLILHAFSLLLFHSLSPPCHNPQPPPCHNPQLLAIDQIFETKISEFSWREQGLFSTNQSLGGEVEESWRLDDVCNEGGFGRKLAFGREGERVW